MNVPITSDLAGYAAFWRRAVAVIVAVQAAGFLGVGVLLYKILRALSR